MVHHVIIRTHRKLQAAHARMLALRGINLPCEAMHVHPAVMSLVPSGLHACMQEFFREDMGLPLTMTPDYNDFSCQVRAKES